MFPLSLHPEGARLPNLIFPVLNEMFILQQVLIRLNITPAEIWQSGGGRRSWAQPEGALARLMSSHLPRVPAALCSRRGHKCSSAAPAEGGCCWCCVGCVAPVPCSHWRGFWHYLLSPCLIPTFSPFCPHFRFPRVCSYTLEPSRLSVQERSRRWIRDIRAQCCKLNGPIFYFNRDQCLSLEQRAEMER